MLGNIFYHGILSVREREIENKKLNKIEHRHTKITHFFDRCCSHFLSILTVEDLRIDIHTYIGVSRVIGSVDANRSAIYFAEYLNIPTQTGIVRSIQCTGRPW